MIPPIVSVAGVLFPREHEEPVSGIVTVLVVLLPVAVPREQPEKPPVQEAVSQAHSAAPLMRPEPQPPRHRAWRKQPLPAQSHSWAI